MSDTNEVTDPPLSFATYEQLFDEMSKRHPGFVIVRICPRTECSLIDFRGNAFTAMGLLEHAAYALKTGSWEKPQTGESE